ncbi:hypothetical protein ACI782_06880 [Geodermatophilus sp. SYSU D00703]
MEAPYTSTGPGQSVRLVYQVMGSNGPIPNPQKIRYIPAGSADVTGLGLPTPTCLRPSVSDASAVMGAVQLANLGVSVVDLAISAAVLVEVKKQTRILREMQVGLQEVRAGISGLLTRAERIDVTVAELNLRETLNHALKSACKGDEVDLVLLAQLVAKALDRFFASMKAPNEPGMNRSFTLASDVREMAEAALHILWGARLTAVQAHNLACSGDPLKVVGDDGLRRHLEQAADATTLVAAMGTVMDGANAMADKVADGLRDTRLFWGDSDIKRKWMHRQLAGLQKKNLDRLAAVSPARRLLAELQDHEAWKSACKEGGESVNTFLRDYLLAWSAHTDAGLLWRLRYETNLQADATYWEGIDGWMQPMVTDGAESVLGVTRPHAAVVA